MFFNYILLFAIDGSRGGIQHGTISHAGSRLTYASVSRGFSLTLPRGVSVSDSYLRAGRAGSNQQLLTIKMKLRGAASGSVWLSVRRLGSSHKLNAFQALADLRSNPSGKARRAPDVQSAAGPMEVYMVEEAARKLTFGYVASDSQTLWQFTCFAPKRGYAAFHKDVMQIMKSFKANVGKVTNSLM